MSPTMSPSSQSLVRVRHRTVPSGRLNIVTGAVRTRRTFRRCSGPCALARPEAPPRSANLDAMPAAPAPVFPHGGWRRHGPDRVPGSSSHRSAVGKLMDGWWNSAGIVMDEGMTLLPIRRHGVPSSVRLGRRPLSLATAALVRTAPALMWPPIRRGPRRGSSTTATRPTRRGRSVVRVLLGDRLVGSQLRRWRAACCPGPGAGRPPPR
jgi:hypothetical protein